MTALTPIAPIQHQSPSQRFNGSSGALTLELGKCLKLVAPSAMNAEAQAMWLAAAIDALEDIRVEEVAAVSAEVRRSVTRHAQIVPEIARLVAELRQRRTKAPARQPLPELPPPPPAPPLSREEIAAMPAHVRSLGLKYGHLVKHPDGTIDERA